MESMEKIRKAVKYAQTGVRIIGAAAKTRADLWLKAIGSGGVFYLIVDMIMKLLK